MPNSSAEAKSRPCPVRRLWLLLTVGIAVVASAALLFGWARVRAQRMLTMASLAQSVLPGERVVVPVFVRDGVTGEPLAGVELVAWAHPDDPRTTYPFVNYGDPVPASAPILGRGRTDGAGTALLEATAPSTGTGRIIVDAHRGLDTDRMTGARWRRVDRATILTTDRPAYRAGDPVRLRARLIDEQHRPIADQELTVNFEGPERAALPVYPIEWIRGNERPARFTVTVKTSRFGVGSAELRLPVDTAPGIYTAHADWLGRNARLRVDVDEPAAAPTDRDPMPGLRGPFLDSVPEWLVSKQENRMLFRVTDHTQQPIHAKLEFPGLNVQSTETNPQGVAALLLQPPDDVTSWEFEVRVTDDSGHSRTSKRTHRIDPHETVQVLPDRSAHRVGDELRIGLASASPGPVFVDLQRGERVVRCTRVELPRGRGELKLTVSEDMLGLLNIEAYRPQLSRGDELGTDGTPLERYWVSSLSQRKIYVVSGRELTLRLDTDRQRYRPGDVARVSALVTQPSGLGPAAALSLGSVSAAELTHRRIPPGDDVTLLADGELLCPGQYRIAGPKVLFPDSSHDLEREYLLARLPVSGSRQLGERRWWRRHFQLEELQRVATLAAIGCGSWTGLLLAAALLGTLFKRTRFRPGIPAILIGIVVTAAGFGARLPIRAAVDREEPHPPGKPGCIAGFDDRPRFPDRCPDAETFGSSTAPLVWIPELATDPAGLAHVDLPIPDVKGTHVLIATAFTLDGRMATARTTVEIE
jgi:hypothetical protein